MSKLILKSPQVSINAVDLSANVQEVEIEYGAEVVDITCSGAVAKEKLSGLIDWKATVKFAQNYDAGSVDATLFPLVGGAAVAVAFRPTSAVKSATNPSYEGNALVASYPPIAGKVGDLAVTTVKLEGTGVLNRVTA